MNRFRYYVNVETPQTFNNEQKMELLAEIRNALRNFRTAHPELDITVSKELTNEDIMESLREQNDNN